jgi:XTP/dITP diphosphohydrolase
VTSDAQAFAVLVATTNRGKLAEIRDLFVGRPVTLLSLADLPVIDEPEETGETFEENAELKARYYDAHLARVAATRLASLPPASPAPRILTVAEDSGLVIDALDGEPGVRSARFLGPDATYAERFTEIERRLAARPDAPRTARFVCALAAVHDGTTVFTSRGEVEGAIADEPAGTAGFGYDPVFWYPPYGATFGQVSDERKRAVSHRRQAFVSLFAWFAARDYRA